MSGTVAATRPHWPATRLAPCHDIAGTRPRHGSHARASAHLGVPAGLAGCLCIWLGFWTDFRTDDILGSPLGPVHEQYS